MPRARRTGVDTHAGQVSTNAHLRSWVAGVLDANLTVQVWGRSTQANLGQLRVLILCPSKSFAEELKRILGFGSLFSRERSVYLRLHPNEAMALYIKLGAYMRGPARYILRAAGSWAATLNQKTFSGALSDEARRHRTALLAEIDLVRRQGAAWKEDEPENHSETSA